MSVGRLSGKVAVITGGASGIGLATAASLAAEGAQLALLDRDSSALAKAKAMFEGANTHAVDVSRPAEIERALREIAQAHGGIDVLFANAGVSHCPPLFETTEDAYDQIVDINFKGVFFTVVHAMPHLRSKASVILTSSALAERGQPGDALYGATKAAVRSMARTFAADDDVKAKGIRVNVISPGPIRTPMTEEATKRPEVSAWIAGMIPLGRWGEADEVANAVVFLASDLSSYITGASIAVDGGLAQV